MAYGYRAMFVILRNYIRNYKLDTIRKMISRWAPTNENHTENYIRVVAERSGILADELVYPENREIMIRIVAAMSYVENGVYAVFNIRHSSDNTNHYLSVFRIYKLVCQNAASFCHHPDIILRMVLVCRSPPANHLADGVQFVIADIIP